MDVRKTVLLAPGHYVVAVSGGVDSVVLLDVLRQLPGIKLTVAHFDHGIRTDSHLDKALVEKLARQHELPFVYAQGALGPRASEDIARKARYDFLRKVQKQTAAVGIITAHHLDDVLETATHNLLRGTGRKGMSSLKSVDGIVRPLLHVPKEHLITYAKDNNLEWREDSTNSDMSYRRNYIRHHVLPKLKNTSPEKYTKLKILVRRQTDLNNAIDNLLHTMLHVQPGVDTLRRSDVISLPHNVALELVAQWLRQNGKHEFGRKHLERATIALKVARPHTKVELDKKQHIKIGKKTAKIVNT